MLNIDLVDGSGRRKIHVPENFLVELNARKTCHKSYPNRNV